MEISLKKYLYKLLFENIHNNMRKPIAADRFYDGEPTKLHEQIYSFLFEVKNENIQLAIVPHAGYIYSGRCAGEVYSRMFDKNTEKVILIGPNHSAYGDKVSFPDQHFLTPLGKVEIDFEAINYLLELCNDKGLNAGINEHAHDMEHSLEVQLPFLQAVLKKNFKIIPIILNELTYEECLKLAIVIYHFIHESKKNIKIIISSDFSHIGEDYGFQPFKENLKENLYKFDEPAINAILQLNSREFYNLAQYRTICGVFGITIGIELAKMFNLKKTEKVSFYTSGDVTGDYKSSVNYAGIVFK